MVVTQIGIGQKTSMNFRYKFTRLISRVEQGAYQNAIIVWDKRARLFKHEPIEGSHFTKSVPVQWEWFIGVNLWLLVFDFTFKTGEK